MGENLKECPGCEVCRGKGQTAECVECLFSFGAKVVHAAKFPHGVTLMQPLEKNPTVKVPLGVNVWVDVVASITPEPGVVTHNDSLGGPVDVTNILSPEDWQGLQEEIRQLLRIRLGAIYLPVTPSSRGDVPVDVVTDVKVKG